MYKLRLYLKEKTNEDIFVSFYKQPINKFSNTLTSSIFRSNHAYFKICSPNPDVNLKLIFHIIGSKNACKQPYLMLISLPIYGDFKIIVVLISRNALKFFTLPLTRVSDHYASRHPFHPMMR